MCILQMLIDLGKDFQPTCMAHPDTYVNKIVIGSKLGKMELWNFVSGKKLFTFDFGSEICCIKASPALDVVGVGLSDGWAKLSFIFLFIFVFYLSLFSIYFSNYFYLLSIFLSIELLCNHYYSSRAKLLNASRELSRVCPHTDTCSVVA